MEPNNTNPSSPPNLTPPSAPDPSSPLPAAAGVQPPGSSVSPSGSPAGGTPPAPGSGAPSSGQVISGGFDPSASALPGTPPAGPAAPAGAPGAGGGITVGATDPLAAAAPPPSSGRSFKPLLIVVVALLVILGGTAAAYFAVILPNKPENVLKAAFINSIQEKQSSTSGTVDATSQGVKATFSTAENAAAKAADIQLNLTVSGVSFPVEARLVNQNIYVKFGDLSTLAGLLNVYSPQAGSLAQTVSGQLSNKWIVFDSTLIDQSASLKCVLNTNWTLTNADVKLIEDQYNKHPFTTIKSTASDTVGGKSAEKFVLSLNNSTFNDFGNGLRGLSVVGALSKCSGSMNTSASSSLNKGTTPLTVWVDKGTKHIVQVANQTNGVSTTVTLHYAPVSITAPSGAEPALQVLTSLQSALAGSGIDLSQLLGGANVSASGTL